MPYKDYVTVTYSSVNSTTDEAVCLDVFGGGEEVWVPRSLIKDGAADLDAGFSSGEIEVEDWFAKKEGLV